MSDSKTIFHKNRDGTMTIQRHQDVEGILESNKRELIDNEVNDKSFGRKVASIPNLVIEQWMKEGINVYQMGVDPAVRKAVMRKLNSPEWRYLRTHNSRL